MNAPPTRRSPPPPRILALVLGSAALVLAWFTMTAATDGAPWYERIDLHAPAIVDALALNSGVPSLRASQSGQPAAHLLALDFRLRRLLGQPLAANLDQLAASPEPLQEFPALVRSARLHGRLGVMLFLVAAAGTVWLLTRSVEAAALTPALLAGSAGLLSHGNFARPELLATILGFALLPVLLERARAAVRPAAPDLWLFAAGLAIGIALQATPPAVWLLAVAAGWCALVPAASAHPAPSRWLLPLAAGAGTLLLLHALGPYRAMIGPTALGRVRLLAVVVAVLPALTFLPARSPRAERLASLVRDLSLLAGGVLVFAPLAHLGLRLFLPVDAAAESTANVLKAAFSGPVHVVTGTHGGGSEVARLAGETPFLVLGGVALAVAAAWSRSLGATPRAWTLFFTASGLGLLVLLGRDRAADSASVLVQAPLLLAWAVAVHGWHTWREPRPEPGPLAWAAPVVLTTALVLLLTAGFRLGLKQRDGTTPALAADEVVVSFLYSHSSHPHEYVELMDRHYGSRENFAAALRDYLAEPAHRH